MDSAEKRRGGVVSDHSLKGDYLLGILFRPKSYYKKNPDLLPCLLLCYWGEGSGYEGRSL